MTKHIIVGAGPTGTTAARLLAESGDDVRLISRTPRPSNHARIEHLSLDGTDVRALTKASEGASTIFMCAMPSYDRWPQEFIPLLDGSISAAESVGARLVIVGNLYGYGEDAPTTLTESLPLRPTTIKGRVRAEMWERAVKSKAPAIEVRASDYLGKGALSLFLLMVGPALLAGQPAASPGDVDAPHAWTFTDDVARTLVATTRYDGAWNRAFHVPSQHVSPQKVAARYAELAGAPLAQLSRMTRGELAKLAENDSILHEVIEMTYLQERPYVLDATETQRVLGVEASSLDTMLRDALRAG